MSSEISDKSSRVPVYTSFGQESSAKTRIKEILDGYPVGPPILREYLQNADDSGAKTFGIVLDQCPNFGNISLENEDLNLFVQKISRNTCLVIYNDSIFSEDDFFYFKDLGKSRKEKDFRCIGTYGIGINSSYHLSDFIYMFSRDRVIIFDPLKTCFKETNGGASVKFVENGKPVNEEYKQILKCFFNKEIGEILGIGEKIPPVPFHGTLFLLSLRSEKSEFSQPYPEKMIRDDIFLKYSEEVENSLLYMKNVSCVLGSIVEKDRSKKTLFKYRVGGELHGRGKLHQMLDVVQKNYDRHLLKKIGDPVSYNFALTVIDDVNGTKTNWRCFCRFCDEKCHEKSLEIIRECGKKNLPYTSLTVIDNMTFEESQKFDGSYFVFLPLPIYSKLPVNINSYFAISKDRRSFKKGRDVVGKDRFELEFNLFLFSEMIANTYADLLKFYMEKKTDSLYSYFPTPKSRSQGDEKLEHMFTNLFKLLEDHPYLRTSLGNFLKSDQVFVTNFPDCRVLDEFLRFCGIPLVDIHQQVLEMIVVFRSLNEFPDFKIVDADYVKSLLMRESCKEFFVGKSPEMFRTILEIAVESKDDDFDNVFLMTFDRKTLSRGKLFIPSEVTQKILTFEDFSCCKSSFVDLKVLKIVGKRIDRIPRVCEMSEFDFQNFLGSMKNPNVEVVKLIFQHFKILRENKNVDIEKLFASCKLLPIYDERDSNGRQFLPISKCGEVFVENVLDSKNYDLVKNSLNGIFLGKGFKMIWEVLKSPPQDVRVFADFFQVLAQRNSGFNNLRGIINKMSDQNKQSLLTLFNEMVRDGGAKKLDSSLKTYVRSLEIFESYNSSQLVSIRSEHFCVSNNLESIITKLKNCKTCLKKCETVKVLGVRKIEKTELIERFLLVEVESLKESRNVEIEVILKNVLEDGSIFRKIKEKLWKVPFIPVGSLNSDLFVKYEKPNNCINGGSKYLTELLKNEPHFPIDSFFLRFSEKIYPSRLECETLFSEKSCYAVLNKYLIEEDNISILSKNVSDFVNVLRGKSSIAWIETDKGTFVPPQQVFPPSDRLCVDLVSPVSKYKVNGHRENLGMRVVTIDIVKKQIDELKSQENLEEREIKDRICEIYSFLNESQIRNMTDIPIWVGGKFESMQFVARECAVDCPFLHSLPSYFLQYQNLLKFVKTKFSHEEYLNIFSKLTNVEKEYQIALDLIKYLVKNPQFFEQANNVLLPNRLVNKFSPPRDLLFIDRQDLYEKIGSSKDNELVHPRVDMETAKLVGCCPLSCTVAEENSADFSFGEDWSQKEEFTTRIRNILDSYFKESEGEEILKVISRESLQNTDDSGACKFALFLDENVSYPDKKLLGEKMREFQKVPSLVTFNDGLFSDFDFSSIKRVGEGTKKNDPTKIGRFNLGVNVNYSITDVQFLTSGKKIVVFDPHCKYLPGKGKGRMFDFSKTSLLFEDQMKPLEIPEMLMKKLSIKKNSSEFPGTLFRFPARTYEQAKTSLISDQWFDVKALRKYLEVCASNSVKLVIFLKNVREMIFGINSASGFQVLRSISIARENLTLLNRVIHNQMKKEVEYEKGLLTIKIDETASEEYLIFSCGERVESTKAREKYFASIAVRKDLTRVDGSFYCFLPLDVCTGAPFHVNSFFELDDSRRNVPSTTVNRKQFNTVIPKAMFFMILNVKSYSVFPSLLEVCDELKSSVKLLFKSMYDGMKVIGQKEGCFYNNVVLPDKNCPEIPKIVGKLLKNCGKTFVETIPEKVVKTFEMSGVKLDVCSPLYVLKHLNDSPTVAFSDLRVTEIRQILGYVLKFEPRDSQERVAFVSYLRKVTLFPNIKKDLRRIDQLTIPQNELDYYMSSHFAENECLFLYEGGKFDDELLRLIKVSGLSLKYTTPSFFSTGRMNDLKQESDVKEFSVKYPEFIEQFWLYVSQSKASEIFQTFPLIPTMNSEFHSLQSGSNGGLVMANVHDLELNKLYSVLEKLEISYRVDISTYPGLKKTIENVPESSTRLILTRIQVKLAKCHNFEMDKHTKDLLLNFFVKSSSEIDTSLANILKSMKLFRTLSGDYINLRAQYHLVSKLVPEVFLEEFGNLQICLSPNARERVFLRRKLGVVEKNYCTFLCEVFLKQVQRFGMRKKFVGEFREILFSLKSFSHEKRNFQVLLSAVAFVPGPGSVFLKPSECFDSRIKLFNEFDECRKTFPSQYMTQVHLELVQLGMTSTVKPKFFDKMVRKFKENEKICGILFEWLKKNLSLVVSNSSWRRSLNKLKTDKVKWIPVMSQENKKKRLGFDVSLVTKLTNPQMLISRSWMLSLVCFYMHPTRNDISSSFARFLGIDEFPNVQVILKNLARVREGVKQIPGSFFEVYFDSLCQLLKKLSQSGFGAVYRQLVNYLKPVDFIPCAQKNGEISLKNVSKVFTAIGNEYLPFFFPLKFSMKRKFRDDLGIMKTPTSNQYIELWKKIQVQQKYVPIALQVVPKLCKIVASKNGSKVDLEKKLTKLLEKELTKLPFEDNVLDSSMPNKGEGFEDRGNVAFLDNKNLYRKWCLVDNSIKILHSRISRRHAELLGVEDFSQKLGKSSEIFHFRQEEKFYKRVNKLLTEEYEIHADPLTVYKEFVQNSHDSGARNLKFVFDFSKYLKNTTFFSKGQESPALIMINDSEFSDDDWKYIQDVSNTHKLKSPEKIGRFGLGILSYYNLSDFFQIFSSNRFVVFDPLGEDFGRWVTEKSLCFEDQFLPFSKANRCSLKDLLKFKGTVVRIPLREKVSKISKTLFSHESKMRKMMNDLVDNIDRICLFTKGIESVQICEIVQGRELEVKYNFERRVRETPISSMLSSHHKSTVVSFLKNGKEDRSYFILNKLFMRKDLSKISKDMSSETSKLNQTVMVALRGNMSKTNIKDSVGELFTGLPLNIFYTKFLLNASLEISRNRQKVLINKTWKDQWNLGLLELLGELAAELLGEMANSDNFGNEEIFQFLLSITNEKDEMFKHFYSAYIKKMYTLPIFRVGKKLCKLSDVYYIPQYNFKSMEKIFPLLIEDGFMILKFEKKLVSLFDHFNCKLIPISCSLVLDQYRSSEKKLRVESYGENQRKVILKTQENLRLFWNYILLSCSPDISLSGIPIPLEEEGKFTYAGHNFIDCESKLSRIAEIMKLKQPVYFTKRLYHEFLRKRGLIEIFSASFVTRHLSVYIGRLASKTSVKVSDCTDDELEFVGLLWKDYSIWLSEACKKYPIIRTDEGGKDGSDDMMCTYDEAQKNVLSLELCDKIESFCERGTLKKFFKFSSKSTQDHFCLRKMGEFIDVLLKEHNVNIVSKLSSFEKNGIKKVISLHLNELSVVEDYTYYEKKWARRQKRYYQQKRRGTRTVHPYRPKIRKLPIFEDISGQYIRVISGKFTYHLGDTFKFNRPEIVVLLKSEQFRILDYVQIFSTTKDQFFAQYIIPNFSLFTEEQQLEYFEIISKNEKLLESLKSKDFYVATNGKSVKASSLYSVNHYSYEMLPDNDSKHSKMKKGHSRPYIAMLECLGANRKRIDEYDFVQFYERVTAKKFWKFFSVKMKDIHVQISFEVIRRILNENNVACYNRGGEKKLMSLFSVKHPKFISILNPNSFVFEKSFELMYLTLKINYGEQIKELKYCEEVSPHEVLEQFSAISQRKEENPEVLCVRFLEFFRSHRVKHIDKLLSSLCQRKVIYVGTVGSFLEPSTLLLKGEDEFSPFVVSIRDLDCYTMKYSKILELMGAKQKLTKEFCLKELKLLYQNSNGRMLNIVEYQYCLFLTRFVINWDEKNDIEVNSFRESYLLTKKRKLFPFDRVFIADKKWINRKVLNLNFFEFLDPELMKWCDLLEVKKLSGSGVLRKMLNITDDVRESITKDESTTELMKSDDLKKIILHLTEQTLKKKFSGKAFHKKLKEKEQEIMKVMGSIQVFRAKKICFRIFYKQNDITLRDVTESYLHVKTENEENKIYFLNEMEDKMVKYYVVKCLNDLFFHTSSELLDLHYVIGAKGSMTKNFNEIFDDKKEKLSKTFIGKKIRKADKLLVKSRSENTSFAKGEYVSHKGVYAKITRNSSEKEIVELNDQKVEVKKCDLEKFEMTSKQHVDIELHFKNVLDLFESVRGELNGESERDFLKMYLTTQFGKRSVCQICCSILHSKLLKMQRETKHGEMLKYLRLVIDFVCFSGYTQEFLYVYQHYLFERICKDTQNIEFERRFVKLLEVIRGEGTSGKIISQMIDGVEISKNLILEFEKTAQVMDFRFSLRLFKWNTQIPSGDANLLLENSFKELQSAKERIEKFFTRDIFSSIVIKRKVTGKGGKILWKNMHSSFELVGHFAMVSNITIHCDMFFASVLLRFNENENSHVAMHLISASFKNDKRLTNYVVNELKRSGLVLEDNKEIVGLKLNEKFRAKDELSFFVNTRHVNFKAIREKVEVDKQNCIHCWIVKQMKREGQVNINNLYEMLLKDEELRKLFTFRREDFKKARIDLMHKEYVKLEGEMLIYLENDGEN